MKHHLLILFSRQYARLTLFTAMAMTLNRYFDHYPVGSEPALYDALYGHPIGPYVLLPHERRRLRLLALWCGGWFTWNSESPTFHSWREWHVLRSLVPVPVFAEENGYR